MVPLVGTVRELNAQAAVIRRTAEARCSPSAGERIAYLVGTMIETPRAAVADSIGRQAEFFSFGTNDLTQMTLGFSRDDAGKFLPATLARLEGRPPGRASARAKRHEKEACHANEGGLVGAVGSAVALFTGPVLAQSGAEGALWENRRDQARQVVGGRKTCLGAMTRRRPTCSSPSHYQWKAATRPTSAMPAASWWARSTPPTTSAPTRRSAGSSIPTNDEGARSSAMAARVPRGPGRQASGEMTQAQLENIDCLVSLLQLSTRGGQEDRWNAGLAPQALNNPQQMLSIAQNISKPTNEVCMRCRQLGRQAELQAWR